MGRIAPDPPGAPPPGGTVAVAPAGELAQHVRCAYCTTWGSGTRCDGCGAPLDWTPRHAGRLPPMPRPLGWRRA